MNLYFSMVAFDVFNKNFINQAQKSDCDTLLKINF